MKNIQTYTFLRYIRIHYSVQMSYVPIKCEEFLIRSQMWGTWMKIRIFYCCCCCCCCACVVMVCYAILVRVILYAPMVAWKIVLALALYSDPTTEMSKESQKTKSKAEMCNNLMYVYACAAPNISILNIFGYVNYIVFVAVASHSVRISLSVLVRIESIGLEFCMQFYLLLRIVCSRMGFSTLCPKAFY